MDVSRALRRRSGWESRLRRMLVVSALAHAGTLGLVLFLADRAAPRPLPLVAYTVELTNPSALGGRMPAGPPGPDLSGGPSAPEPKAEPVVSPPQPEAKPEPKPKETAAVEEPAVRIPEKPTPPEPKPEAKKPEPPAPEPKKPEPPKPEPPEAKKPEPPKPEPKKPEPPKPVTTKPAPPEPPPARAETKPAEPTPAKQTEAKAGTPAGREEAPPRDAYAAAAERWKGRAGGGLGGTDAGSGPVGAGGEGGGGGQLVALEVLAYRQQVINTIKSRWTNVIARPGLVAAVRFEIAPDGQVSNIRLAQSSGNPAYDASAVRAVQHASQLPPPPARYANDFREFIIEFHSEESGGQGAG